jgi:hypothetical protein
MTLRSLVWMAVVTSSCARAPAPPSTESAPAEMAPGVRASAAGPHSAAAPSGTVSSAAMAPGTAGPSSPGSSPLADAAAPAASIAVAAGVAPAAPEPPLEGENFEPQALALFRVAACGASSGDDLPSRFDAAAIARHCDELGRAYREYQRTWIDVVTPFIAALRPADLPKTVVYPFGGGDLTSALATFPDATEITTISLEPAGDIRPIDTLAPERLGQELAEHRAHLERLLEKAHSRTDNLDKESKTDLPGEIVFDLAALAVYGDEPLSLRYFRLRPDGTLAYVTKADLEGAKTSADRKAWVADFELRFRHARTPEAPTRVLRHISFNLDDVHLRADPSLVAHLNRKGTVAAMTKAASHLLWSDQFSTMRGWLLDHTDWMISDSTGIPPRFAVPAGFQQDTYGTFGGPAPFGLLNPRDGADFRKLFASEPAREVSFRYGYPDKDGHGHLVVTRRVAAADGGSASAAPGGDAAVSGAGPGPAAEVRGPGLGADASR